jgi:hypothetical protein
MFARFAEDGRSSGFSRPVRETSNLEPGTLARPGIYVVSHFDPAHTTPHEVLIKRGSRLPHCKFCRGGRFSLKSAKPQTIEESFFFSNEAMALVSRLRAAETEVLARIERSQDLLKESRQTLDKIRAVQQRAGDSFQWTSSTAPK